MWKGEEDLKKMDKLLNISVNSKKEFRQMAFSSLQKVLLESTVLNQSSFLGSRCKMQDLIKPNLLVSEWGREASTEVI